MVPNNETFEAVVLSYLEHKDDAVSYIIYSIGFIELWNTVFPLEIMRENIV